MAISAITTSMMAGVNYTTTTDNSTDWSAVTNNSYFYDKTNKIVYYKNNNGVVVGAYDTFSGGTVTGNTVFTQGLTANTISATTYQNLPPSTFSGGTVTGPTDFTAGLTATTISAATYYNLPLDIYVTGATYSNNTFTFTNNTGGTFNTTFNDVTGLTVNGNVQITGSISGSTNTISTDNMIIVALLYLSNNT